MVQWSGKGPVDEIQDPIYSATLRFSLALFEFSYRMFRINDPSHPVREIDGGMAAAHLEYEMSQSISNGE